MPRLLTILQWLAGLFGVACIYIGLFLYETTERQIQNSLEDLWLKLSFDRHTPITLARQVTRLVLTVMDKFFERAFGQRWLSFQVFAVSWCFAYAALTLGYIPLWLWTRVAGLDMPAVTSHIGGTTAVATAGLILLAGTLPAIRPSLRWITYFTTCLIVVAILLVVLLSATRERMIGPIPSIGQVVATLLLSLVYGMIIVHVIRRGVHVAVRGLTRRRDRVLVSILVGIPAAIFMLIVALSIGVSHPNTGFGRLGRSLQSRGLIEPLFSWGAALASVWGLAVLVFAGLALLVLLHLAMWPIVRFALMRILYAAQREELIKQKKILQATGWSLVAFGFGSWIAGLWRVIGQS